MSALSTSLLETCLSLLAITLGISCSAGDAESINDTPEVGPTGDLGADDISTDISMDIVATDFTLDDERPPDAAAATDTAAPFDVAQAGGDWLATVCPDLAQVPCTLPLELDGSLQNPAWSPDGRALLLTRFREGYNREPADLILVDLTTGGTRTLVADGSANVSLPGSVWNAEDEIVFSSSREPHDEIYVTTADASPGDEIRLTARDALVAYEPSWSPDASQIVFESHPLDVEGDGVITLFSRQGQTFVPITTADRDCRQPNWAPMGDWIVYQALDDEWHLWLVHPDGSGDHQLTSPPGSQSDASFSPDGGRLVFSGDGPDVVGAELFGVDVMGGSTTQLTSLGGYAGAPSWSPDGQLVAFERSAGDPEGSTGTLIGVVAVGGE